MQITLTKKNDATDKSPLVIQFVEDDKKHTLSVAIGETVELPDHTAYDVLGRYKGLFVQGGGNSKSLKNYSDKSMKE